MKLIWHFFGGVLLGFSLISIWTSMDLHCGMMYYDYGSYYCTHYQRTLIFEAVICFIGSMLCFNMGKKE